MSHRLPIGFVLSILLLSTLACATGRSSQEHSAAVSHMDGSLVLVVPFNLGIRRAPALDEKSGALAHELIDFLHAQGAEVHALSQEDASELWAEAFNASGSQKDLKAASSEFARLVASEGDFDMLVMPSVVIREARVRGDAASWDGVRRELETSDPIADPRQSHGFSEMSIQGLDGQVAAASLHVVALGEDGSLIFEGLAGLDLMQKAQLEGSPAEGQWKLEAREEPLRDLDHVREGIEMAFERRLPRSARSW